MFAKHLTVTLPDGTKKVMKFRGKTMEEAERKLQEAKIKIELGILVFNNKTPFAKVAKQYFDTYVKSTGRNRQTLQSLLDRVFVARLGNVPISEIKPMQIKQCLNTTDGQSQSQYAKAYNLINGIFRVARGEGLISTNPMDLIPREKRKAGVRRSLTQYEREIFWQVVLKHPKGLFFALIMGCGLRPGEVSALTWANVDLEKQSVTVTQAMKRNVIGERGINIGAPKTEAGYRTIPIPNELCQMLKDVRPQDLGFVIRKKNGKPINEYDARGAWKSFYHLMQIEAGAKLSHNQLIVNAKDIGQDITPYYLRHTYATMLCENNVPIKAAQYFMGHTDSKMLMDIYADNSDIMQEQGKQILTQMQLQKPQTRQKVDIENESGS